MHFERIPVPAEHLEPISEMSEGVIAARTVQEVFRALFLFAARASPATGIFVALYTPATGLRRCVYSANMVGGGDGEPLLEEDQDLSIFPEVPLNKNPQSQAIMTGDVVVTADYGAAIEGLPTVNTGSDYEERPPRSSLAVPFGVEGRVLGAFEVQSTSRAAFGEQHVPPLRMAASLAAIAVEKLAFLEREQAQHEDTLRALGIALEYRDYETKGHIDRVVELSLAFGRELSLDGPSLQALRWGAYLHDLGKVAIPDRILLKPGPLTKEEFEVIRRHILIGIDMCRHIPFLPQETRAVIECHHERWDGTGYPQGRSGTGVPLLARIFSLVDVYDALTSARPYKVAWSHQEAVAEIDRNAGTQFDPELAATFIRLVSAHVPAPDAQ